MAQQQRSRASTGGGSNNMEIEPVWAVQMKQELAGLTLNEQEERLRPGRPVQLREQTPIADDYTRYPGTACENEDPSRVDDVLKQTKKRTVIAIEVHPCDGVPAVDETILVGGKHVFTVIDVESGEEVMCRAAADGYVDVAIGEEVEFLYNDSGTEEGIGEREEGETEEGTQSGSLWDRPRGAKPPETDPRLPLRRRHARTTASRAPCRSSA